MADQIEADPQALEAEIRSEQKGLDNLLNVAAEAGSKAILQKIKETEDKIFTLRSQRAEWLERSDIKQKLQNITPEDIRYILGLNGLEIRDGEGALELLGYTRKDKLESAQLRRVFKLLIERIELDPNTRAFTLKYRLPVHVAKTTGVKVASPGGFEPPYSP